MHPEGALYFFYPKKRIYTDAFICDPSTLREVEAFALELFYMIDAEDIRLPSGCDLVLELGKDNNGEVTWTYYCADHTSRKLFWLTRHEISEFAHQEVKAVRSMAHLGLEIESMYWNHIGTFPHAQELSDQVLKDLQGTLIHLAVDQITSSSSTSFYSADEAQCMLNLVKDAQELGKNDHHAVSTIGRLMNIFMHYKFLHYHGQHGARLCRDQSVHGEDRRSRTLLIMCLSPIFFNAPDVHLRGLQTVCVDDLINQLPWRDFVAKLRTDWREFVLYATVMLNANIAFLTIPDVDPGAGQQTIAKVFSFISIITSIGSIILGLWLVRFHNVTTRATAPNMAYHITFLKNRSLGLETLSILYSLPYALLMWAMVAFLIAFACECFFYRYAAAVYSTAVFWFIIGALILWCILTMWDSDSKESAWRSSIGSWMRLLSLAQQTMESVLEVLSAIFVRQRIPAAPGPMHTLGMDHDVEMS